MITNVRQGHPTAANMRKLSEKLLRASQAMSDIDNSSPSTSSPETELKTAIFDTQAVKPQPSIPELLHLTDQIASELRLDIGQKRLSAPTVARTPGQSLLHSEDAHSLLSSPSPPLVAFGPFCMRATPGPPSVYVTALQSRKSSVADVPASSKLEMKRPRLPSDMLQASDLSSISAIEPLQTAKRDAEDAEDAEASEARAAAVSNAIPSLRLSPKSLPYPVTIKPELRKSPIPSKRVLVHDLWPSKQKLAVGQTLSPAKVAEQTQLQSHKARLDMNKAVQDAAEIERQMRQKVRARGG